MRRHLASVERPEIGNEPPHVCPAIAIAFALLGCLQSNGTPEETFQDVTIDSGTSYIQWNPPAGWIKHSPQTMTGGAAVADYDNDGWPDLFVTRYWESDILFRNRGDGTFEDVSEQAGINVVTTTNGAAWGDIDNDGDADLYVSVCAEAADPLKYLLYINNGDGTFSEQAGQWGVDQEVPHYHSGFSVCFGDYNRDGLLDIHSCQWAVTGPDNRSILLMNTGTEGGFIDTTISAGVEMWDDPELEGPPEFTSQAFTSRLTDLDLDGWPDLVVAADFETSRLFWNNGDGTFIDGTEAAKIGGDENGMGLAVGDYDGDGLPDLFFTSIFEARTPVLPFSGWGLSGNRLYRNTGNRVFEDTTDLGGVRNGGWGWGAAFFDYDNDGDLDLSMTNGFESDRLTAEVPFHTDPTKLWRNDGGTFTDVSETEGITHTGMGKGLLVFDYDKDGDLDLFIVNNKGTPILYRNTSENGNHWLRIAPRGQFSNRDAIGAVVTIDPGNGRPTQCREISGGSHYLTQSEKIAHFGLGPSTEPVRSVRVRWPSGIEQEYTDVAVDQILEVTEPSSPYQAWLAEHFSEEELAAGIGTLPSSDLDRDELSNALEFGTGRHPKIPNKRPLIDFIPGDNGILIKFQRRNLPRGGRAIIEKSLDLNEWQECRDNVIEILSTERTDNWGVEVVTARLPREDETPVFLRIRVTIEE